ncbi:hypothetical protein [Halomonas sp. V046]
MELGSLGGLDALSKILGELPDDRHGPFNLAAAELLNEYLVANQPLE